MQSENDQVLGPNSRPPLQQQQITPPICWNPQNESRVAQVLPPVPVYQGRFNVFYDANAGGQQGSITPLPQTGNQS